VIHGLIRFAELTRKEIRQILFSPSAIVSQILTHALSLFLLAYAATMDLKDCPFAVLDLAHTAESRAIAAKFEHSDVFRRKADFAREAEVERRISDRDVRMAVVFPANFVRNHAVDVITDGRNTVSAGLAISYAASIFSAYVRQAAYDADGDLRTSVSEDRAWFNPLYSPQWFQIPGLLAQLLLMTLAMTIAIAFAKELECGTLDQLRLTPHSFVGLLAGKSLAGAIIGLAQFLLTLILAILWFNLPLTGSLVALVLMGVSFICAAVGIGNLIATFCRSQQEAAVLTFCLTIPFTLLSGMTTPISCMPLPFQYFALVNPVTRAIQSLHLVFLEEAGVRAVLPSAAYLFSVGFVCFVCAWLRFRRR